MDRATTKPSPTEIRCAARKRAHDRLDFFLDLAERELLWGKVDISTAIQAGKIVKVDFAPALGEKFDV